MFKVFIFFTVISFFGRYGWYILVGALVLLFYYEKYVKSLILNLKSRYDDAFYAAKYHKSKFIWSYNVLPSISFTSDPDLFESRLRAQEERIQQLQEKYNRDANLYAEKQEEVCQNCF